MLRPRTAENVEKQAVAIGGAHGCASINNVQGFVGDRAGPRLRWTKQSVMENTIGAALVEAASAMQAH